MKKLITAVLVLAALIGEAFAQSVTPTAPLLAYNIGGSAIGLTTGSDVFCVGGSLSKQVRIQQIRLSGTATVGTVVDASVVKRSAPDTGGTASAMALVPLDSTFSAATSSASAFTVAPSTGAPVGVLRSQRIVVGGAASPLALTPMVFDFTASPSYLLLRGPTELACVNVGAAGAGAAWDVDVSLTEQ